MQSIGGARPLLPVRLAMLILAAGRGTRLGGPIPKAYVPVGGRSLVERSVERLAQVVPPDQRSMVLAVHPDDRDRFVAPLLERLQTLGLTRIVDGGATRAESMSLALAAADPGCDLVLVHDAARPFFPVVAAQQAVGLAEREGAALLALPARDTLKGVATDGTTPGQARVTETLDREKVWLAQTPQVIRRDWLEQAWASPGGASATDDVALIERLGHPVWAVQGTAANLKVTTAEDLILAEALAAYADQSPNPS